MRYPHVPFWLKTAVMSAGLLLGTSALAAQPWISVPSAMSGKEVVVTGGALKAGETVRVRVTDPSGQKYTLMDVADADGALSVQITPGADGKYKVEVLTLKGKRIGGGDFLYSH
jgi:hypothetical protein